MQRERFVVEDERLLLEELWKWQRYAGRLGCCRRSETIREESGLRHFVCGCVESIWATNGLCKKTRAEEDSYELGLSVEDKLELR